MSHLLRLALFALALTAAASAQTVDTVIDSVFFHTGAPYSVDRPRFLPFGFGRAYTDSIDQDLPTGYEREIPAFPPQSFYVLFDAIVQPAWIDRDIRGIPDSVLSGRARHFAIRHEFGIQRGQSPDVTVVFPRAFPPNIDSINFRDAIGGAGGFVFSTTMTAGPDSVLIPSPNLTTVRMIVYYNATNIPTAIPSDDPAVGIAMNVVPNPVRSHAPVRVVADAALGSRLEIVDLLGRVTVVAPWASNTSATSIDASDLGAGLYFARLIDQHGRVLNSSTFLVVD